jgi:SAM-dependent methyltransferase
MSSVSGTAEGLAADSSSPAAHAVDWAARELPDSRGEVPDLFARSVHEYACQHTGEPVKLLLAGCTGHADDLGLEKLRAGSPGVSVMAVDQDHPLTRTAGSGAGQGGAGAPVLGDLRTIPLPPRTFDIICCAHLLDRIEHAELVLDRLTAALRPGGLLLLRFRDRESAAGRLDRILPDVARRAIWHWLRPQQAGPFPAIYEPLLSADGMHSYLLVRGLVIAERQTVRDRPARPARLAWGAPLACRLIAALSRGRITDSHDDLLYVIRKPENRFARVL